MKSVASDAAEAELSVSTVHRGVIFVSHETLKAFTEKIFHSLKVSNIELHFFETFLHSFRKTKAQIRKS